MTDEEVAGVAGALTPQERDDLTIHWDEACDGDPLSRGREIDGYWSDMESNGWAELVPVDDDALEDPFAYERGIEPGGFMWRFTPLGLAVRAHILANAGGGA